MAKKEADQEPKNPRDAAGECDLDDGYVSPIKAIRDLTPATIRSALVGSRYLQILIAITVAGTILRFYHLGFNALWLDEAWTYAYAVQALPDIWKATASGEFNSPLFYALEHFMLMAGSSETVLRFIPAVSGVLLIPLFYLVGKEFYDRNTGLIAAAGCAFSPYLIYYSQEARAFTPELFFIGLGTLFLLRALRSGMLKHWVLSGVFCAVAFWFHYFALVMIAGLMLYALVILVVHIRTERENLKGFFIGAAVFVVVSLPPLYRGYSLLSLTASSPTLAHPGLSLFRLMFFTFSGSDNSFMIVLLILFAVGVAQAFLLDKRKGFFLAFLMMFTCLIAWELSYKRSLDIRYVIFLILVFIIGIALSYRAVYRFWNSRAVVYLFIAGFVLISVPALTHYYSGYSKEDWRGFSGSLAETVRPGDLVVSVPGYISVNLDYYYSPERAQVRRYQATTAAELAAITTLRGNGTVYFVVQPTHLRYANPNGSTLSWLRQNARPGGVPVTKGISLFRYP